MAKLYVVGTPIGNLSDMTYRAVEALKSADFIAAEDTRVTGKLLKHFGIEKPLMSYHEHNRKYAGDAIIRRILSGESCAVVTDAGMPCISDPGEDLVRLCAEHGVPVIPVPGPSAGVTALSVSGLDTSKFTFVGFLSTSPSSRKVTLEEVEKRPETLIFYEAPHKLCATLKDLLRALGDRKITICRELTKLHEEIIRTSLADAVNIYNDSDRKPKGEFVLIVEGYKAPPRAEMSVREAALIAQKKADGGMKPTDACREAAKETGFSKSEIYNELAAMKEERDGA